MGEELYLMQTQLFQLQKTLEILAQSQRELLGILEKITAGS